ncbi:MAG TPA: hypothetical protein O0X27_05645 [Methanocorpusculum sp.]|nr:hypothetical protein [Methanocorpusculum sp.]
MDAEESSSDVIWAFGRRSDYAHAYCGRKGYDQHLTLCGISCAPKIPLKHWDLSNEVVAKITCPKCRERLAYVRFMTLNDPDRTNKDGCGP